MNLPLSFLGFSHPGYLYLLIPLLFFLLAGFLLKRRLSRKFDDFFAGESLFQSRLSSKRSLGKGLLLSFVFCSMVFASAGPVFKSRLSSYDFMALVDISQSMWCEDYEENGVTLSRLEMAKRNLLSLLDGLPADGRLGLGVFAGRVDSVLILTPPQAVGKSRSDLRAIIQSIRYSWTWDDGTNLKGSLLQMGDILKKKKEDYGAGLTLIVLTDGEETRYLAHERSPWEPSRLRGVHLYLAGHGTPEGAPVPEFDDQWKFKQYRVDHRHALLISRLDERYLKKLAKSTGGTYKRVVSGSDLQEMTAGTTFKLGKNESRLDLSWMLWLASSILLSLFLLL